MAIYVINISAIPAQRFKTVLDGQFCTITLRLKGNRIYLDLDLADQPICRGMVCVNGPSIVQLQSQYFVGSLHFFDIDGNQAPQVEGLNTRWFLLYLTEDEPVPPSLQF